jgi:hypothetical protein
VEQLVNALNQIEEDEL